MQISIQHKFAFLSMPKCASTSIEATIAPFSNIQFGGKPSLKHITAQGFSETILPLLEKFAPSGEIQTICLVRKPQDWIESWYRYRSRNQLKKRNYENYTGNISYDEFIAEYISKKKRASFANLKTQYEFLRLSTGDIGLDHIIPLENLHLFSDFLSQKTGNHVTIPALNVSVKKALPLDPELSIRLDDYLAEDSTIYQFAKEIGHYQKALHFNELKARLQSFRDRT